MAAPIIVRFTRATPAALDTFAFATDDTTALTFYQNVAQNAVLDLVNDPDPAAGLTYEVDLFRNRIDTGRKFFSSSLSAASAGRMAIGPISISPGQYQFNVAQRLGALTAQSWIVKLMHA